MSFNKYKFSEVGKNTKETLRVRRPIPYTIRVLNNGRLEYYKDLSTIGY